MKEIIIDFNNEMNRIHRLESILLSSKKSRFIFGLISKEININYHLIEISNLQFSTELEVANPKELIRLQVLQNGQEVENNFIQNLKIRTPQQAINVIFDESQIVDCLSEEEEFQTNISFDICFTPESKGPIKKHPVNFQLTCLRAESEPNYQISIHEDYLEGKEYRGLSDVEIGYIELESCAPYSFSKYIERCDLNISFNDANLKQAISLGEIPLANGQTALTFSGPKAVISNIVANQQLRIPILVDFTKIANPDSKIQFDGKLSINYLKNNITLPKEEDFFFHLLPDTKTAALFVEINEGGPTRSLKSNEVIPDRFIWKGKGKSGKTRCFTISLGNIAESGPGGIIIQDFQIAFKPNKDSASPILALGADMDFSEDNLDSFFKVNGAAIEDLPNSIQLPNEVGGIHDFKISFQHDLIGAIPKDIATIDCKVNFKFAICNQSMIMDEATTIKPFNSEITFKIEKYSGNHWLALDFGTSATVAAFTGGANIGKETEEELLINLQTPLQDYVIDYDDREINEKNSPFLSSEILLRPSNGKGKAMIESTNYKNDIVKLSPPLGESLDLDNIHLKVPFLKSLIGMGTIPIFHEKLNDYEYHVRDNGEKFTFREKPIQVKTLLANTYRSLIRDFIIPQIGNHEQLNKIIISIPNTFTPLHLDLIRDLILEKFPNFRKDYIDFISESDAVACNYLVNWESYNFERPSQDKDKKSEYVLVYDIGAGTTDLTYFSILKDEKGKKEVEILGRLGKATAGNYLDYVIAKIIDFEFNSSDKRFNYTELEHGDTGAAMELKTFIRNNLKPRLANEEKFSIYIDPPTGRVSEDNMSGTEEFDCSRLLEHPSMQLYLKQNSEELINEFFDLFPMLPSSAKKLKKGEVPIDTVIFTGRTIQFQRLQDKVKDCIQEWSENSVYFTPVKEAKGLKNVVVKGALQYALRLKKHSVISLKNRNLLARYGILYTDPLTFQWKFKEFLNPSTKPINSSPNVIDGLTIYEYDTDIENALEEVNPYIDLSATPTGLFVQSFSSDTARDANDSNWEYITEMFRFDQDEVATSANINQVKVRIVVDARNEMHVSIGNFDDGLNTPLKMDLKDNQTFRKSMWPYL